MIITYDDFLIASVTIVLVVFIAGYTVGYYEGQKDGYIKGMRL